MTATLYFAPGASSMAPHVALHEVGAPFEAVPLSFTRRENREAAYLRLNPEGKVPTLVVDGRPLTEVLAILFFLARRHPAAALLPDDPRGEAEALSWMSFLASTVHPARRHGLDHARTVYALAERRLGSADWAVGQRHSVADIHLFRLFWRFNRSLRPDPAEFPNLLRHHARMMERPAVQRTLAAEAAIGYELRA